MGKYSRAACLRCRCPKGQQPRKSNRRNHFLDWRAEPALGSKDRGSAWPEATVGFHEQGQYQDVTPATPLLDERGVTARVYCWLTNHDTSRGTASPTESDFLKHNTTTHKPHSQDGAPVVLRRLRCHHPSRRLPFFRRQHRHSSNILILYHCPFGSVIQLLLGRPAAIYRIRVRDTTPACVCDCDNQTASFFFLRLRRPLSSFSATFSAHSSQHRQLLGDALTAFLAAFSSTSQASKKIAIPHIDEQNGARGPCMSLLGHQLIWATAN